MRELGELRCIYIHCVREGNDGDLENSGPNKRGQLIQHKSIFAGCPCKFRIARSSCFPEKVEILIVL